MKGLNFSWIPKKQREEWDCETRRLVDLLIPIRRRNLAVSLSSLPNCTHSPIGCEIAVVIKNRKKKITTNGQRTTPYIPTALPSVSSFHSKVASSSVLSLETSAGSWRQDSWRKVEAGHWLYRLQSSSVISALEWDWLEEYIIRVCERRKKITQHTRLKCNYIKNSVTSTTNHMQAMVAVLQH